MKEKIPLVRAWISQLTANYSTSTREIPSFKFSRLPKYFQTETLSSARVVIIDKPPVPSLSLLGLKGFETFENMPLDGITYDNTYFIRQDRASDESLHFHEMVHVTQWGQLGIEEFLLMYAMGHLKFGYENNPFEMWARHHQVRFENKVLPYSIEQATSENLQSIKMQLQLPG